MNGNSITRIQSLQVQERLIKEEIAVLERKLEKVQTELKALGVIEYETI